MRDLEVVEQPMHFDNLTQRLVKETRDFLEERQKDQAPFLLYLPWIQVHTFLHTAKQFAGKSRHGRYGDNVEELDWSVGQILDMLQEFRMKNNTFVYFSSDNGGHPDEKTMKGEVEGGYNGIYRGMSFFIFIHKRYLYYGKSCDDIYNLPSFSFHKHYSI